VAPGEARVDSPEDRYVRAVLAEVGMEDPWDVLDTVYVGGGTPTRLSPARLGEIVAALRERFGLAPGAEVSLEANPEDWSPAVAEGLRAAGFDRVSFGAQSYDREVLGSLGRLHAPADTTRAVAAARAAGFRSINVDLIYGTPGESVASWRASVESTLAAGIDHLSAYALTVERGTALSRAVVAGAPAPDPDDQADKYEMVEAMAAAAGLVRYEVSNWARPGHAVDYNLITWAQGEYAAFGLGAHGHRAGIRRRNLRRLEAYLEAVDEGRRPEAGRERLGPGEAEQERVILGLRRAAGVVAGEAGSALLAGVEGERLLAAGVIARRGDRVVVERPLLTDAASRAVLSTLTG
jgi:putative oxygen-independent coproporphyrinogen III oxidase